jgi:hypothetical protein
MTFEDIVDAAAERLNITGATNLARIGRSVNWYYKRLTSSMGLQTSRRVLRQATTSIGIDLLTFANCTKLSFVEDRSVTPSRVLEQVTTIEIEERSQSTDDAPRRYAVYTQDANSVTIRLDCIPQTAFTLYAEAMNVLATLSGTDEPSFPEDFHDILIYAAIFEERMKMERSDLAEVARSDYETRLGDLRIYLAKAAQQDIYQGKRLANGVLGGGGSGSGGGSGTGSTSYTQTGLITFDRSSVSATAPPFAVEPATAGMVANLDADKLDGQHGSFYQTVTNLIGVVQGDLLYGSATDVVSKLAKNTSATRYLSNTGSSNNPAWAQVALATGVSGILPQANGGFPFINVKEYGAVGDGSTDDTTAIQNALNALSGNGGCVYFPVGTYKITSELTTAISKARLMGDCFGSSILSAATNTQNHIVISGNTGNTVSDIVFTASVTKTAGSAIQITHASTSNSFSLIERCYFNVLYVGIELVKAATPTVRDCYFTDCVRSSISVQNTYNVDQGDGLIEANFFNASTTGMVLDGHIYMQSAGGLRILHNKVNKGKYAFHLNLASGAATAIMRIQGNTFDATDNEMILLESQGGGAVISMIDISGNEFASTLNSGGSMLRIATTGNWIQVTSINGNTFNVAAGTKAITLEGGSGGIIDANIFYAQGASCTGITLGAGNDYFEVTESNVFARSGTAFATVASNSSATSRVYGLWMNYSPTWGNTGTANTLTNATITGRYRESRTNQIDWKFRLVWGAATACGNGSQTFSLPVASTTSATGSDPAACLLYDSSVGLYSATACKFSTTSLMIIVYGTVSGGITATAPFTWATGDVIDINGSYERA